MIRVPAMAAAVALALGAASAAAQPSVLRFQGYARDLDTGKYLYTEVHEQNLDGERWLGGRIDYYDAAGDLLGRKMLDFPKDPFVPLYRMDLVQEGYAEGIRSLQGGVTLVRQLPGRAAETKTVPLRAPMTADSGIHMFLRSVFDRLMHGDTVPFRIAVPGSLDSFAFRARRLGDSTFEGRPAVVIRLEPDSLFRLLAAPLDLTYGPAERKLVEYRGVSNVHDPRTGHPYNVRISYESKPPADAPRLKLERPP
ncbi:MAG TPA: hypothetical protein VM369_00625 [Candidatus Binatia bacterium]|nr:hypothetical protein [Candidatus Binatia bacterium]